MSVLTDTTVFQTNDLAIGYGGQKEVRLFEHLNLILTPGKLTCFMGPNGIGKSTLIRTLAGLHKPLAGELPPFDEKKISLVLTGRVHSAQMTVRELIGYGRYPYLSWSLSLQKDDQQIIDKAVDATRIAPLLNEKIDSLSDGQMQLVMIARALAQETPIMLLDEPTAHLDLNNRLEIMMLLRRLAKTSNKAILVATHELDLALQTADVVWLATQEKKIKSGIPEDLVLDGSFDEVFQFKGFDLKTGKVQHVPWRNKTIQLKGEGAVFLWTKNALERNGFEVNPGSNETVQIENGNWFYQATEYSTLKSLLEVMIADPSDNQRS